MRRRGRFGRTGFVRIVLVLWLCLVSALELPAAELKVETRLIWGTDDTKTSDPKCKAVDDATAAKFRKIFKWKHYFEVNRQTATIPSRSSKRIKMSAQCTIEITELEGPKVEAKLIGDGKDVNKTTSRLSKGESFIIAGECKNGSAWFVLITELDEK